MLVLDRPSSLLPLCAELTIPDVIVFRRANGLPMATTNSPCRTWAERPRGSVGKGFYRWRERSGEKLVIGTSSDVIIKRNYCFISYCCLFYNYIGWLGSLNCELRNWNASISRSKVLLLLSYRPTCAINPHAKMNFYVSSNWNQPFELPNIKSGVLFCSDMQHTAGEHQH